LCARSQPGPDKAAILIAEPELLAGETSAMRWRFLGLLLIDCLALAVALLIAARFVLVMMAPFV
jgi:hypothetical protein